MLVALVRTAATLVLLATLLACGPRGGRETLELLEHGDEGERLAALERLSGRPDLLDGVTLGRVAGDAAPLVRAAAAKIAGVRGDAASIELLAKLADDRNPGVRTAALRGLGKHARHPGAKEHLLAAYSKHGLLEREAIAQALIEAGGTLDELLRHEATTLWERNFQGMEAGGVAELVGALEELGRSGRQEAVERLGTLLASPSHRVSLAAARGLGASRDPAARPWLEARLDAENPALRMAAVEALGALGDPGAIPSLAEVAKRQGEEGLLAARSLVRLEGAAEAACAAAPVAKNPRAAAWLARHAAAAGGCAPLGVEDALATEEGFFPAVQVAKELRIQAAVLPLLEVARDEEEAPERRLAALEALGGIGGPAAVEGLEAIFLSLGESFAEGREKWVRGPLPEVWAEGFAPEEEAERRKLEGEASELLEELHAMDELLLLTAGKAAVGAGSQTAREMLSRFVDDPASGLRAAAVLAAKLPLKALWSFATEDPSWEVRAAAVRALGAAEGAEVLTKLGELVARPLEVRQVALEALEARKARDVLVRLRADDPLAPDVAAALGRLGDVAAAKALLGGDVGGVTPEWIDALRHVRGRDAAAAARRHLHHDRAEIRKVAAEVLGARCDGVARPLLAALAQADYHVEVRQAAQQALAALQGAGCSNK